MRNQYTVLKALRDSYGKLIPSGFSTSKTLIPEIRRHISKVSKMVDDEMKQQYDAVFESNAQECNEFPTKEDTSVSTQ